MEALAAALGAMVLAAIFTLGGASLTKVSQIVRTRRRASGSRKAEKPSENREKSDRQNTYTSKKIHTHYDNLKISRSAPPEVIRAAYKALAQKYHPDRNNGSTEAEKMMQTINASYEVLSDPAKRREHDEWITKSERSAAQATSSSDSPHAASTPHSDAIEEALAFGLSVDEIEYLEKPILATHYIKKYWILKGTLLKAVSSGKLRSVISRGVLWVQDRRIT